MAGNLRVKTITGDIRHLARFDDRESFLRSMVQGYMGSTVWFDTIEGPSINGAHIVEVGDVDAS